MMLSAREAKRRLGSDTHLSVVDVAVVVVTSFERKHSEWSFSDVSFIQTTKTTLDMLLIYSVRCPLVKNLTEIGALIQVSARLSIAR